MDRDFLKKVIKEGVVKVLDGNGKDAYMRVSGQLDTNYISVINDKEIDQYERLTTLLCMVLCDVDGNHLYDYKNEEDLALVRMMPDEYSMPLVEKFGELFSVTDEEEKKT